MKHFESVDQYIASQPENVQRLLARLRAAIRKAMPGAEETISYQMPAYKLHGRVALYFAGWKEHYALYPASKEVIKALAKDLASYSVSKGTIRFPLSTTVPTRLIARIAKVRTQEIAARKKASATKRKKRSVASPRRARAAAR
jgi:uncharacterized protein YdhG (YjbR/CyaY superfamily)